MSRVWTIGDWRARQVVVLGLMGAGKSTLSAALSERLARPLRDNDLDLWATYRTTAKAMAEADGVAALHAVEARLLLTALAGRPFVVAAAASTIERQQVRTALRSAGPGRPAPLVVWIDGPDALLAARFSSGPHRPDLGQTLPLLADQREVRGPLMRAASSVRVDARTPTQAQVDRVLTAWRGNA